MKKFLIVSLSCLSLSAQMPSLSTGVKDVPYFVPNSSQTFASACTSAISKGLTLLIGRSFNVSAGTYSCYVNASKGGKLILTGAVNINSLECTAFSQCIDGTNGTITFLSTSPQANPIWWGADPTNTNDSALALNACINAGSVCSPPQGVFKIASPVSIIGINHNLNCTTRQNTKINYTGAANLAALIIGDGTGGSNNNQVNNCWISGNINLTKAAIYVNKSDITSLNNVTAGNSSAGFLVVNSVSPKLDTPACDYSGAVIPLSCITFSGNVGTTYANNQSLIINAQINCNSIANTTGITLTAPTVGSTVGTKILNGFINSCNRGIDILSGTYQNSIDNIDLENFLSGEAIRLAGTLTTVDHVYLLGAIHITSTGANNTVTNCGAIFSIIVDAGAKNTLFSRNTFDPGDSSGVYTTWLTDNGTNTSWQANYWAVGNVPLEDFVDGIYNNHTGVLNYVGDSGANNALAGTFVFSFNAVVNTIPVRLVNGLKITMAISHTTTAGSGTNKLNFAGTGAVNIRPHINPGGVLTTGYINGSWETFIYSTFNGAWLAMGQ